MLPDDGDSFQIRDGPRVKPAARLNLTSLKAYDYLLINHLYGDQIIPMRELYQMILCNTKEEEEQGESLNN